MNLDLSPELRAFRDEVRAFIRAELPADIEDKVRRILEDVRVNGDTTCSMER